MDQSQTSGHIMPYATLVRIWAILLLLTALLVFISMKFHEALAMWAMLVLTPLKAGLVMFYFMHLKFEKPLLKTMVIITLGTLIIFIGLTFSDILYR
jgi:cytochrome c oxidase subunit IV